MIEMVPELEILFDMLPKVKATPYMLDEFFYLGFNYALDDESSGESEKKQSATIMKMIVESLL